MIRPLDDSATAHEKSTDCAGRPRTLGAFPSPLPQPSSILFPQPFLSILATHEPFLLSSIVINMDTDTDLRRLTDDDIRRWLQPLQPYQFFRLEDLMNQERPTTAPERKEECSTCHFRLCTRRSPCSEHPGRCSCHVCHKWWKRHVQPFKGHGKGDKGDGKDTKDKGIHGGSAGSSGSTTGPPAVSN